MKNSNLIDHGEKISKRKKLQRRSFGTEKRNKENIDTEQVSEVITEENEASGWMKKGKHFKNNKRKSGLIEAEVSEFEKQDGSNDAFDELNHAKVKERKEKNPDVKKRKNAKTNINVEVHEASSGKKKGKHSKNKKRRSEQIEAEISEFEKRVGSNDAFDEFNHAEVKEPKENKPDVKKRKNAKKNINTEVHEASSGKKKRKQSKNQKSEQIEAEVGEFEKQDESDDTFDEKTDAEVKAPKEKKSSKKKRKNAKTKGDEIYEIEGGSKKKKCRPFRSTTTNTRKTSKKDRLCQMEDGFMEKRGEAEQGEVYELSSGDEDSSRGMKKWIVEYHRCRPGVEILQRRIDDFIVAHEAQEEQARKEREAQAAEGGWTVVVHHKGRKKTTESETGVTVGSVAQAAVMDNMAKKKSKAVGLDFYRFQRREAQRSEVMLLQSKFEQDKKRIQQLRAARKFRPY